MDFVERLKFFLIQKNISITQFADSCKISRPTLSQIMNYRNKRISDEIISKIHQTYPNLSLYWLLFGEGVMEDNHPDQNSIVRDSNISDQPDYNSGLFNSHDLFINKEKSEEDTHKNQKNKNLDNIISTTQTKIENMQMQTTTKTISKIVVFYNDNSYESFGPSKII